MMEQVGECVEHFDVDVFGLVVEFRELEKEGLR